MNNIRTAWGIGIVAFILTLILGFGLIRMNSGAMGFGEVSGIVHAALGIGFFSGAASYIGIRVCQSRQKG